MTARNEHTPPPEDRASRFGASVSVASPDWAAEALPHQPVCRCAVHYVATVDSPTVTDSRGQPSLAYSDPVTELARRRLELDFGVDDSEWRATERRLAMERADREVEAHELLLERDARERAADERAKVLHADAMTRGSRWGRRAPVVIGVAAVASLVVALSSGPDSPVYPTCPPGPTPKATCVFVPTAPGPQAPTKAPGTPTVP